MRGRGWGVKGGSSLHTGAGPFEMGRARRPKCSSIGWHGVLKYSPHPSPAGPTRGGVTRDGHSTLRT
ncbi:hypothetical protein F751_5029 [Auxenochlorella protothecoides]|uniref:Uncharacterized protein n=1 Tax=Auxenochlorella protothecoides TaxID=3075 RepID=A0A087SEN3_AUXPR|nr:hypothetical protein F751_5029 [Auxenochlorella protothecoides]KFM24187.1 hypothetical protein F751_5029 [Auxenochlorella protothecoides]